MTNVFFFFFSQNKFRLTDVGDELLPLVISIIAFIDVGVPSTGLGDIAAPDPESFEHELTRSFGFDRSLNKQINKSVLNCFTIWLVLNFIPTKTKNLQKIKSNASQRITFWQGLNEFIMNSYEFINEFKSGF